jgi:hypothetical protein
MDKRTQWLGPSSTRELSHRFHSLLLTVSIGTRACPSPPARIDTYTYKHLSGRNMALTSFTLSTRPIHLLYYCDSLKIIELNGDHLPK